MLETSIKPYFFSLTDIQYNISQLHNTMYVQINMNLGVKNVLGNCKLEFLPSLKSSFHLVLQTTSVIAPGL